MSNQWRYSSPCQGSRHVFTWTSDTTHAKADPLARLRCACGQMWVDSRVGSRVRHKFDNTYWIVRGYMDVGGELRVMVEDDIVHSLITNKMGTLAPMRRAYSESDLEWVE